MLFAWRKYNTPVMLLSGALAGLGFSLQWLFYYKGDAYSLLTIVLYILLTLISGAVFGGLLPKWIGDALNRAGIVRNFELGKQTRAMGQ